MRTICLHSGRHGHPSLSTRHVRLHHSQFYFHKRVNKLLIVELIKRHRPYDVYTFDMSSILLLHLKG